MIFINNLISDRIFITCFLVFFGISAQTQQLLTTDEAVKLALEHNYGIKIANNSISSWTQYSILVNIQDRDKLIIHLQKNDIPTAVFYRKPFNMLELYKDNNNLDFNISLRLSQSILSLPMHPYLTKLELDKIIKTIKDYYA